MARDFFPYHPLKLRAALAVSSAMCAVLLAWSLSSAMKSGAPQDWARAGLCLGLQLAMGYVLMRLAPRDGWGVRLEGTVLKVSRPIEGVLEIPWSAVRDVHRSGSRRDTLVLSLNDERRVLLPAHLFARRAELEALARALEERLPAAVHDA